MTSTLMGMKYKFYEEPSEWADKRQYTQEINWIAKNLNLKVSNFMVDDETFGEPVLFYEGKYFGYLDNRFYWCFDRDDFQEWWQFDN